MTTAEQIALPAEVYRALREFCAARKTGQLTLNIKDGVIRSATLNEPVHISGKC